MSSPLLFRAFVLERLTATAEDIIQLFERTTVKYEEEASSFKREIERLRGLLQQKQQVADCSSPSSASKEEIPFEERLGVQQEDKEPQSITVEYAEHWAAQQQLEEGEVQQFRVVHVSDGARSIQQDDAEQSGSSWDSESEFEGSADERDLFPLDSTPSSQALDHSTESESKSESDASEDLLHASFPAVRVTTDLDRIHLHNFKCLSCSKRFSYSQHLINHAIRMHSHDSSLLCTVCGMTLGTTEHLNCHLQRHKSSKFCYLCGRECSTVVSLNDHMTIHSRVKLHHCQDCGSAFSSKSDLKVHTRLHIEENLFCCPDCGQGFPTSRHMWSHKRTHTGSGHDAPDVCGRGFPHAHNSVTIEGPMHKHTDVYLST